MRNVLVIKTLLNQKGFEEGLADLKRKGNNVNIFEKIFQRASVSAKGLTRVIGTVGKALLKIVGTAGLLAVALGGVLLIASGLYKAFKKAWEGNEQVKTDLEYIKFSLSQAFYTLLKPIIEWMSQALTKIVNWLHKMLAYINYIGKAWFGVELFANASVEDFKKANGEATKLKKTLAGFDEMNILNDNGTVGVAGALTPSFDLGKMEDVKIPSWMTWVTENKTRLTNSIKAIGEAWAGLVLIAKGNFAGGLALIGAGIKDLIKANKEYTIQLLSVQEAEAKHLKSIKDLEEAQENYKDTLEKANKAHKELEKIEKQAGMTGEELYNLVKTGKKNYDELTNTQKELYKAYLNNEYAQNQLKEMTDKLNEAKHQEVLNSLNVQLANAKEKGSYDELKQSVLNAFNEGKISADEARQYFSLAMGEMSYDAQQTFKKDIPDAIEEGLKPSKYQTTWDKFRTKWNEFIKGLKTLWNNFWDNLKANVKAEAKTNGNINSIAIGTNRFMADGGIANYKPIKLASGAVINRPGTGVPIGGEAGPEGVIPMSNEAQMELIGRAIAKYLTINLTNITDLDGRTIARSIKRIQGQNDFAMNR